MIYDLPLLLFGKKLVTVHLREEATEPLETKVMPLQEGSAVLFSTIQNMVVGFGTDDDFTFKIGELKIENGVITVQIVKVLPTDAEQTIGVPPELILHSDTEKKVFTCSALRPSTISAICFEMNLEGRVYSGKVKIAFVAQEDLYDIALDFGSEASQMAVYNRAGERRLIRQNITGVLKDKYYDCQEVEDEDIHQFENGELYRSIFFVKKDEAVFNFDHSPGENENELVPLISYVKSGKGSNTTAILDTFRDKYRLITNLKVANAGAYNFPIGFADHYKGIRNENIDNIIGDVQQWVLNGLLTTAFSTIEDTRNNEQPFYVRVKILTPNVLSQEKMASLITGTQKFLSKQSHKTPLVAFDVTALSESDASFLGYWWEPVPFQARPVERRIPGQRFLIIDMGKGTTDFSIIKSDGNLGLTSEFRSGFIGAGNVITYAFIETIFTFIFGKNAAIKQEAIKRILMADTSAFQIQFLKDIEAIKANYGTKGSPISLENYKFTSDVMSWLESASQDANNITDSNILTFLKEILDQETNNTINDKYGYIESAVNDLCQQLWQSLGIYFTQPDLRPNKVILTGRSFLFKPLLDTIVALFKKENIEVEVLNHPTDFTRLKKICLEGAYSDVLINYESNLSGFPLVISEVQTSNPMRKEGYYDNLFNNLKVVAGLNERPPIDTNPEINDVNEDPDSIKIALGKYLLNDFNPNRDRIYVSGKYYKTDLAGPNNSINLYFDGKKTYSRTGGRREELQIPATFHYEQKFQFETLFPFNSTVGAQRIKVAFDADSAPEL